MARKDWPRARLKHLARLSGGGTPSKENVEFWQSGDIPWVSPKDMKRRIISETEDYITAAAVDGSATAYVEAGSPLVVVRSGILRHTLPVAISGVRLTLNQDMKAFRLGPRLDARFFTYWIEGQSSDLLLEWRQFGATVESIDTVQMMNGRIAVPDLPTQQVIADFLDRETARIVLLIEKKQQFFSRASLRIEALVATAISDDNVPRVRFGRAALRAQRPVVLSEHDELVRLGLYNRGRGIFKKPAADEDGMGDSSFYFVKSGDLILSGQFAWEGAVALASQDEDGCVVSHRYPVYRGKRGINTAYLLGLLRTNFGDFLLNEASRGSAGRNRPLNTVRLEKEKIPVPGQELQSAVENAILFERRLKVVTGNSIDRLREFRAALITAAVTGQIDPETWSRRGATDRRLGQIEAEMGA